MGTPGGATGSRTPCSGTGLRTHLKYRQLKGKVQSRISIPRIRISAVACMEACAEVMQSESNRGSSCRSRSGPVRWVSRPRDLNAMDRVGDNRRFCSQFVTKNRLLQNSCTSRGECFQPRGRGVSPEDCPNCGGSGYVAKPVDWNGKSEGVAFIRVKCPTCGGSGRKLPSSPTTVG